MINLSKEFCSQVQEARRRARLSQSALAREVGCHQSALSAFEQGDGTKLNDEVIERLATKFGLEIPRATASDTAQAGDAALSAAQTVAAHRPLVQGFCPNPLCPSNHTYRVGERLFAKPDRTACDPIGGTFCVVCGEILEKKCPNCGAPLHEGAVCTHCGTPYVTLVS